MASAYIAWYLFFAGAGAFAIASVVDFALRLGPRPRLLKIAPITDIGMVLGPIMVAVGCVFLLLDLGDPSIVFNVFLRPSSILGFGSWAIVLFRFFAALSLVFGLIPHCRASKLIEPLPQFLAMALSFVVILYSGIFYSLFPSVPFLNTPLVPALFTASAFSSGAGLLVAVGFFRQACEGVLDGMNGLSARFWPYAGLSFDADQGGVGGASASIDVRDTAVCLKLLLSLSKNPSVKLLGVSQCKSLFCGKISGC